MATFAQLRDTVIAKAGATDMFEFRRISPAHNAFWDEMNNVEFQKGYTPGKYEKLDTPALCEMDLLTQKEFNEWVERFAELTSR